MAIYSRVAEERRWQAESDARVLATAEEIRVSKPRLTQAKKAATRLLAEEQKTVNGLKKVTGVKSVKSPAKPLTKKSSRKKK